MQAIIMAAGKGSRMGELTEEKPKAFLEIRGKKIIEYTIDMLHKYGIWDISIVIGYKDTDFRKLFQNVPGISLVYNPFYEMTNVIGSFWVGRQQLRDDFIYIHADTLCDTLIFEELIRTEGDLVLPVDTNSRDEEAMKVRVENGHLIELSKKMDASKAMGEFIGIMKITRPVISDLIEAATELMREKRFNAYFEEAVQILVNKNKYDIRLIETAGRFWREMDFPEDFQQTDKDISQSLLDL